jgi:hypothetical protein
MEQRRIEKIQHLKPFREFTPDLIPEQIRHLNEDAFLYEEGKPRYICSLLGTLYEELDGRPELQALILEAVWMARRMNDAGKKQDDLNWF